MSFGDFGNFGSWSPSDHALNKMVYAKAHKGGGSSGGGGGGNNSNFGCSLVFVVLIVGLVIFIFRGC